MRFTAGCLLALPALSLALPTAGQIEHSLVARQTRDVNDIIASATDQFDSLTDRIDNLGRGNTQNIGALNAGIAQVLNTLAAVRNTLASGPEINLLAAAGFILPATSLVGSAKSFAESLADKARSLGDPAVTYQQLDSLYRETVGVADAFASKISLSGPIVNLFRNSALSSIGDARASVRGLLGQNVGGSPLQPVYSQPPVYAPAQPQYQPVPQYQPAPQYAAPPSSPYADAMASDPTIVGGTGASIAGSTFEVAQ